jgi:hypothetical protein
MTQRQLQQRLCGSRIRIGRRSSTWFMAVYFGRPNRPGGAAQSARGIYQHGSAILDMETLEPAGDGAFPALINRIGASPSS